MGGARPRDRREQILGAAAVLFQRDGFDRVSVVDVAAAVGVTSRAIYRHFPSKHAVLAAAVSDRMTRLEALVADAQSPGQLIDRVAELMVDTRDLGVLVQREARHLDPGPRAELDDRMAGVVRQVARSLPGRRRTAVGNEVAAEMLAVLASPSWHGVTLPPSLARALLRDMAMAIARTEPTVRSRPPVATRSSPASRREVILGAAIGLFAARGYAAVRMEDVGASVGIAGPSIYEHFAGKADLLMTALTRGAEWLQLGMARALDGAVTAEHALAAVARSYVEFADARPDLMGLLLTEMIHLPDEQRHVLRRVQAGYVEEWARLVRSAQPRRSPVEARFIVHGVIAVVNDRLRRGADGPVADADSVVDVAVRLMTMPAGVEEASA